MRLRDAPDAWAARLGISREAVELWASAEPVDLHLDSYIWTRLFGYDLGRRHGRGLFGARFYSHADLPRMIEVGMAGVVASITTFPFHRRSGRTALFLENLAELRHAIHENEGKAALVSDHAGYLRARAAGKLAVFVGIQGGNALDTSHVPVDLGKIPGDVISRITLVHLSHSTIGASSAPVPRKDDRLTEFGRAYVAEMNRRRILVDLAHASPGVFWDALDAHDRSQPAIVSHTGVSGVTPHWRNVDDAQVRAIAERGGVVGIIFHSHYLGGRFLGGRADEVVAHLEHVIHVGGEDAAAIGTDFDGMICPPRDTPTVTELPVLVERLLARGHSAERIRKLLGGNYLRVLREVRPGRA